jgi:ribosomal protein L4
VLTYHRHNDQDFDSHKTKKGKEIMVQNGWQDKMVLLVDVGQVGRDDHTLALATANLPKVKITTPRLLNVYDVLKYDVLVLSQSAADALNNHLRRTRLVTQQ